MIYKKDGKLLVKDGKLCKSCCIGDDCTHCNAGETPKFITVKFYDIVKCTTACQGGAPYDMKHILIPDGFEVVCQQNASIPCRWDYLDGGNHVYTRKHYASSDGSCTGFETTYTKYGYCVKVIREAARVRVSTWLANAQNRCDLESAFLVGLISTTYFDFGTFTNCVTLTGQAWSNTAGCWYNCWDTGKIDIVEHL